MNKISTAIAALILRVRMSLTPTVATIVSQFDKIEAKIERAIDKATRDLDATSNALKALQAKQTKGNADLDAAYKLLHSVSKLKG